MLQNKEIRGTARECDFTRDYADILHKAYSKTIETHDKNHTNTCHEHQKAKGGGHSRAQFQCGYTPTL